MPRRCAVLISEVSQEPLSMRASQSDGGTLLAIELLGDDMVAVPRMQERFYRMRGAELPSDDLCSTQDYADTNWVTCSISTGFVEQRGITRKAA
jgi:hypothetical protein